MKLREKRREKFGFGWEISLFFPRSHIDSIRASPLSLKNREKKIQNTKRKKKRYSKKKVFKLIAFVCIVTILTSQFFFWLSSPSPVLGATYTWLQNNWSGGATTTYPFHPQNQTGWRWYESKDSGIIANAVLSLATTTGSITQTTDTDFNQGTFASTTVESTGEEASVTLAPRKEVNGKVGVYFATSYALNERSFLYSWGNNLYGELGDGTVGDKYNPVRVLKGEALSSDTDGNYLTPLSPGDGPCALGKSGYVYCWGPNFNGQIGDGTTVTRLTPVKVLKGEAAPEDTDGTYLTNIKQLLKKMLEYTCALSYSGNVYCWGSGTNYQLGHGTTTESHVPLRVFKGEAVPEDTDGTYLTNIKQIGGGEGTVCALSYSGYVYCWGALYSTSSPTRVVKGEAIPEDTDGTYLRNIRELAIGGIRHVCAVSYNNIPYCWGENNYGQLGIGGYSIVPVAPVRVVKGEAIPEDTDGTYLINIHHISAGGHSTCAVSLNNIPYCWGNNDRGQLGVGSSGDTWSYPRRVLKGEATPDDNDGTYLTNVAQISISRYSACFLSNYTNVYCSGSNSDGQLGNGTTIASSVPVRVLNPDGTPFILGIHHFYNGTFTSAVLDPGVNVKRWTTVSWSASTTASTTLKVKVRSCNTSNCSDAPDWSTCSPISNGELASNSGCVEEGERYLQYQLILSTLDDLFTPYLHQITINYEYYIPQATLISSPYNTSDAFNILAKISWIASTTASTTVKFQLRTAPDNGGVPGTWTDWYGPNGTSSYFTDPSGNESVPSILSDGVDDQWIQYKVVLETSNSSETPILHSVTLTYVVNAPPEFNPDYPTPGAGGVSVNVASSTQIEITYSIRDPDTTSGSVTPGYITPSFQYSLDGGQTWYNATSSCFNQGDWSNKQVEEVNFTQYTATWNPKCEPNISNNIYSTTTQLKVIIDDNEAANHLASATSSLFTLDTKDPQVGTPPGGGTGVNINQNVLTSLGNDKTSTTSVTLYLSASDDSPLQMIISENSNFSSASWEGYASTKSFTLSSGDGTKTIYVKFKDSFGNIVGNYSDTILLDTTCETPQNPYIQDISNQQLGEYRIFFNWQKSQESDWIKYQIYRSTDGGQNWTLVANITDRDTNYYFDQGLTQGQEYCYQVKFVDDIGNISQPSNTLCQVAGGQPTDVTPPGISNLSTSTVTISSINISWTTDEPATTQVLYSIDNSLSNLQGVTGYATSHQVTLVGLSANTTYKFKVKSCDASNNCSLSATSTFTTSPQDTTPPTISNVTSTNITYNSATISWTTNEPSDSFVEYGTSTPLTGGSMFGQKDSTTTHIVVLTNLQSSTTYYFKVHSEDNSGNEGVSSEFSFKTLPSPPQGDTTPPNISNVTTTNIQYNTATISWQTDEPSSSYVEFGLSTSYGRIYGIDNSTTSHTVSLPKDLTPDSIYHFRVRSRDAAGNEAISQDFTFQTAPDPNDTQPPTITFDPATDISDPQPTSITIVWTTNEDANSYIDYSTDKSYSLSQGSPAMTTSHSVTLVGLNPSTQYYFRIRSVDPSGNEAVDDNNGQGYTFSTPSGPSPPQISNIQITNVTYNSATIQWETDIESTSLVEYGLDTNYGKIQGQQDSVTSHSVTLTGLLSEATYHFRVRSSYQNVEGVSQDLTFTTQSAPDTAPPTISNVTSTNITYNSATISWTTNEPSDSFVEYGTSTPLTGGSMFGQKDSTTTHIVVLTNLQSSTTYYFKVHSEDNSGNEGVSSEFSFKTLPSPPQGDTTPPNISNVTTTNIQYNTATISWQTDEPSSSYVEFGLSTSYGRIYGIDNSTTSHTVSLPKDLTPDSIYHFRVRSRDAAGNEAISQDFTFQTAPDPNDTQPPTITFDPATDISDPQPTSITIVWTTNEDANSYIDYSTDKSYSLSQGSPAMTTSHSVTLVGLNPSTQYYFRIRSVDPSGNEAVDDNNGQGYTFSTPSGPSPPQISNIQITNVTYNSATIQWETDIESTSLVEYGLDTNYGKIQGQQDSVTSHSVTLTGLLSEATYHFRVRSSYQNVEGVSQDLTFTTQSAPDTAPPTISNVQVTNITQTSATISWITDELADNIVEYGISTTSLNLLAGSTASSTQNHQVLLQNLTPGTTYYFQVKSKDTSGNLSIDNNSGNYYNFTTQQDNTPPLIFNVQVPLVAATSVVITWDTDELSTSQVIYGTSLSYGSQTQQTTSFTYHHSVKIEGLQKETTYYFKVISQDSAGNQSIDDNGGQGYTFTTTKEPGEVVYVSGGGGGGMVADVWPPKISEVKVENITFSSVTITWKTSEKSSSLVKYGLTPEYGYLAGNPEERTLSHKVILTNLEPGTTYHFQVISYDKAGNQGSSEDRTFTTLGEISEGEVKVISEREITTTSIKQLEAKLEKEVGIKELIKKASHAFISKILEALPENPFLKNIPEEKFIASVSEIAPKVVSPPQIVGEIPQVEVGSDYAKITWITDKEANSIVAVAPAEEYDPSKKDPYIWKEGEPDEYVTYHEVHLKNLKPSTTYHFQVQSKPKVGPVGKSQDFTFTTLSQKPEIKNIKFTQITETTVTLEWKTTLPTKTEINVIETKTGKKFVQKDESFLINHKLTIKNLTPATSYSLQIIAQDEKGNKSISSILPFSTTVSKKPPKIYQVRFNTALIPGKREKVQTIISWKTDKPATSRVWYEEGVNVKTKMPSFSTPLDPNLVLHHIVITTNFKPGKVYRIKVESQDAFKNVSYSRDFTILTPKPRENVLDLIIKNFEKTFGFFRKIRW